MQTQGKRELNFCLVDRTRQASLILLKMKLDAFRHNFKKVQMENFKPLSKAPIYDYWKVNAILSVEALQIYFPGSPVGSTLLRLGVTRISVKVVEVITFEHFLN